MLGVDRAKVSGIALRARVIAYSACGDLGWFTADLVGAIDAAVADGVDVINYSIGGGASLTSPDDIALLFAADANVWVATSAGNDGPGAATIGSPPPFRGSRRSARAHTTEPSPTRSVSVTARSTPA